MNAIANRLQAALIKDLSNVDGTSYCQRWAIEALKSSVFKKFLSDTDTSQPDARALEKFLSSNKRCLGWRWYQSNRLEASIDSQIRLLLFKWLGDYRLSDNYASCWDLGPGASRFCQTNDLCTKLYASRFSTTSSYLYSIYANTLASPSAINAEIFRQASFGRYSIVKGSKLAFVPKQNDVSRVICTEPLLNMMAQKSLSRHIEECLARHCRIYIRRDSNGLNQPEVNSELARLGSINGLLATIDLESASDSLSCDAVRIFFPKGVSDAAFAVRSAYTELPDGKTVRLGMISSMGNAVTFPMQTIFFYAVIRACMIESSVKGASSAFGDDLICPTEVYPLVVQTLTRLGFVINMNKSFSCGPFRESCGTDYVYGVDVRPVYIKRLNDRCDIYSAFNRLRQWSLGHHVPLFRSLRVLRAALGSRPFVVPFGSDVSSGLLGTRKQALKHGAKPTVHGVVSYNCLTKRLLDGKPSRASPVGQLLAATSGTSRSLKHGLATREKDSKTRIVKVVRHTSVWPGPSAGLR